ncbi:MAG: zf-HC2 domain-containing protein [candidate division Zixibacteria bacterium]|nr:zf-HC2 domain-containing protein [candidate division Zixibacteria bacterium]
MTGSDSHEDWQALIPEYLSGVLPADEKASLDEHLAGCAVCRSVLDNTRQLRGGLVHLANAAQDQHPTAAQITDYACSPARLDSSVQETISRHLALCPSCAREVATVAEVTKELAASADNGIPDSASLSTGGPDTLVRPSDLPATRPDDSTGFTAKATGSGRVRIRMRLVYAIAAVFVALLAFPAYRLITRPMATDSSNVGAVFNLSPQTRGGLRPTEIHVPTAEGTVRFALNVSSLDEYQPKICVLESKSRELLRTTVSGSLSDDQSVMVTVPTPQLPNGDYLFRLIGINKTNSADTLQVLYPFIVRPETP